MAAWIHKDPSGTLFKPEKALIALWLSHFKFYKSILSAQRSRRRWLNIHVWRSEPGLAWARENLTTTYTGNDSSLKRNDLLSIPQHRTQDGVQETLFTPERHWPILSHSNNLAIQKNSSQFLSDETDFPPSSYLWRNHMGNAMINRTEQHRITQRTWSYLFSDVGKWGVL